MLETVLSLTQKELDTAVSEGTNYAIVLNATFLVLSQLEIDSKLGLSERAVAKRALLALQDTKDRSITDNTFYGVGRHVKHGTSRLNSGGRMTWIRAKACAVA